MIRGIESHTFIEGKAYRVRQETPVEHGRIHGEIWWGGLAKGENLLGATRDMKF